MDTDKLIPVLTTILSAILVILVAAFLLARPVARVLGQLDGVRGFMQRDGSDLAVQELAQAADRAADRKAKAAAQGLFGIYTTENLFEDGRNTLYNARDFPAVDALLAERYEKRADPLMAHRYYRSIFRLCEIRLDHSAEHMKEVLDAWVAAHPDAYRARLVRGRFLIERAWHVNAGVLDGSLRGNAADVMRAAEADLKIAEEMNPDDPNAAAARIITAARVGSGRDGVDRAYDAALAVDPLNLIARYNRLYAVGPYGNGDWSEQTAVVDEALAMASQFPLLGILERYAVEARKEYEVPADPALNRLERFQPYLGQLDKNPGDLLLLCNGAYYAHKAGEDGLAEVLFREIGDRFHEDSAFADLLQFNDFRAFTRCRVARMKSGDERIQGITEALAMAPTHYFTNYAYGVELANAGDYPQAQRHLERSRDRHKSYLPTRLALAELAVMQKRFAVARDEANFVLSRNPSQTQREIAQKVLRECAGK